MRPSNTLSNSVNILTRPAWAGGILTTDSDGRMSLRKQGANFVDIRFLQSSAAALFATPGTLLSASAKWHAKTCGNCMFVVFTRRNPLQIVWTVIRRAAIHVVNLALWGCRIMRRTESQQDQPMNEPASLTAVLIQPDVNVSSALIAQTTDKDAARLNPPDSPHITDLISAFVVKNRAPFFRLLLGLANRDHVTFVHGLNLSCQQSRVNAPNREQALALTGQERACGIGDSCHG